MCRGCRIERVWGGGFGYFDSILPNGRISYYWFGPSGDTLWGEIDPDEVMTLAD